MSENHESKNESNEITVTFLSLIVDSEKLNKYSVRIVGIFNTELKAVNISVGVSLLNLTSLAWPRCRSAPAPRRRRPPAPG